MKIFNNAKEIVDVIGIIDSALTFSKWEPILPLAERDIKSIIGPEPIMAAKNYIESTEKNSDEDEFLRLLRQAIAFFALLKITPSLDVQHGVAGRQKRLGENEKGLTALQEYKDEENIRNLAYEAVDALVTLMDEKEFDFWTSGCKKKEINKLLIRDKETFDRYYHIGSHRLFLILTPIISEIQESRIIPIISRSKYEELITSNESDILDCIRRPLALLTIKKAIERLPIEVIPAGVVQVQQNGTFREKVKAEKEARLQVSKSLGDDAHEYLLILQDMVKESISNEELYIPSSTIQSTGITF